MIRVGTASWTDPSLLATGWYPPRARRDPAARLRHYASVFDTVEVDSTYYALPKPDTARAWSERTPPGFLIHVKAYSAFTGHGLDAKALPADLRPLVPAGRPRVAQRDVPAELVEEAWRRFRAAIEPLRDAGKLGYVHFGLPPWIRATPRSLAYLERLRERAPDLLVAVEFRNPSWYARWPEVGALMRELALAHVAVDAPPHPSAPPRVLRATHPRCAVLRCHGRNSRTWLGAHRAPSDRFDWDYADGELDDLARAARELERTAPFTFVVFNNNHGDQGQRNAASLRAKLEREAAAG